MIAERRAARQQSPDRWYFVEGVRYCAHCETRRCVRQTGGLLPCEPRREQARVLPLKLDLGSGSKPLEDDWTGVDLHPPSNGIEHDFSTGAPWPFADGSACELRSSHLIEHLEKRRVRVGSRAVTLGLEPKPRRQDVLFWFFEEAWRVAAPGAPFEVRWPALRSDGAFADPTHYRQIPTAMLHYLSSHGRRVLEVESYDVRCNWVIERLFGRPRKGYGHVVIDDPLKPPPWNALIEYGVVLRREPLGESA